MARISWERTRVRIGSAVTALAIALVSQGAMAQQAGAETGGAAEASPSVDEIVVTARFRSESIQATPIAISALSADQLSARGISTINDVTRVAPNVQFQQAAPQYGNALSAFIRGVGQDDFNFALQPGVGFYLDDVYFGTVFGSQFDLLDLERVEVLRGPQGTLFGRNNEGGAVRIFSKKPTGDGSGYLEASYGRYNRMQIRGAVDIPVVADKLALRLSGGATKSDGYVDRIDFACANPTLAGKLVPTTTTAGCKVGEMGGKQVISGRLALRWTPSATWEVNVSGDYTDDDSQPVPQVTIATIPGFVAADGRASGLAALNRDVMIPYYGIPLDSRFDAAPYRTYAAYRNPISGRSYPDENRLRQWGVTGAISGDLTENLHLRSITAFRKYSGGFVFNTEGSPLPINSNYNTVYHDQFTQELQLSGKAFGKLLEWTVGGFYYDGFSRNGGNIDVMFANLVPGAPVYGINFDIDDPMKETSKSLFAHLVLNPTEKLSIEAGVRYTWEKRTYTFSRFLPDLHGPGSQVDTITSAVLYPINRGGYFFPVTSVPNSLDRADPKIAIQYQWTPDVMTYAQFSTGYKAGGANPRPLGPRQLTTFGPEKLKAYEIGIKSELFDRRLRLNLAAFRSDYTGLQLEARALDLDGLPSFLRTNVGSARIQGVEAEFQARPTGGLLLEGSLGYLDFKYRDITAAVGVPGGPCQTCVTPNTPKWKLSGAIQYDIATPIGTIAPRIDYAYQSKVYNDLTNDPLGLQEGYSLVNARLRWEDKGKSWSVVLAVDNLFDKQYYIFKNFGLPVLGSLQGTPSIPRTWSVTLHKNF